ncbi:hypothetical protein ANN_10676 [Periplaneta americana]|uniref:Uncharacterized protein n=1 Tax=Periplaneta americana TaxID=6978 RepID=A0ABQ8T2X6_PERAM|nr:hypothetical protein ANN_10676 [Periplaneta americana]
MVILLLKLRPSKSTNTAIYSVFNEILSALDNGIMSVDRIEKLYKNFGVLADSKDKNEHEAEYLEILTAVKGSSKEKRLASQFIARFFKYFPTLADQAIEAQLDLCEDEDVAYTYYQRKKTQRNK